MAKILDGKDLQNKVALDLTKKIQRIIDTPLAHKPRLAIIQVGNIPESNTYIRQKILFGQKIGAIVNLQNFEQKIEEESLIKHITKLNSQKNINGIIVQLPIPERLDKNKIFDSIHPQKDVDGQNSVNIKKLMENDPTGFVPATTKGILALLDNHKIPVPGKNVVVIGRSSLVGKPTALAFLNRDATVTICHRHTKNLDNHTKSADILIVAAGVPKLITKHHVSKNQVVVDVGINVIGEPINRNLIGQRLGQRPENEPAGRKLVGDVDFENVSKIVAAITPVPGGIGPMTVASLFENLLEAYTRQT